MERYYTVEIQPGGKRLHATAGENLLQLLRRNGLAPEAPCGGQGSCGKCSVLVDGRIQLACQTAVDRDLTVTLCAKKQAVILSGGASIQIEADGDIPGNLLAIDLGTTTMVCYLLDAAGRELAYASGLNPQRAYGGDVVSRIQAALAGKQQEMSHCVRIGLMELIHQVCGKADIAPESIFRIALVGNPCMQQLLLDISPENLAKIPFEPVLRKLETIPAAKVFPICPHAEFLVIPDISGYVGADTVACVLSAMLDRQDAVSLLVDIGTNGELFMGNSRRMVACATAAGPALEGANIRFGMGGGEGAIDHVFFENGKPRVHVIGEGTPVGICGSGLIDAVAGMLQNGIINHRGRIRQEEPEFEGERAFFLTERICLTQKDIRQVQLAKGAIAAGIRLMAGELGIDLTQVEQVLLAGAFGTYLNPENACAIGLLPPELLPKIRAVGNAAGTGAKLLACSRRMQHRAEELCRDIEYLELASMPEFQREFGKQTNFPKEVL